MGGESIAAMLLCILLLLLGAWIFGKRAFCPQEEKREEPQREEKERGLQERQGSWLDTMDVRGFAYVENGQRLLPLLREGEELLLLREPLNPQDTNAVRVLRRDGQPIGYLPREYNLIPAALLDEGIPLFGKLVLGRQNVRGTAKMQVAIYWEDTP